MISESIWLDKWSRLAENCQAMGAHWHWHLHFCISCPIVKYHTEYRTLERNKMEVFNRERLLENASNVHFCKTSLKWQTVTVLLKWHKQDISNIHKRDTKKTQERYKRDNRKTLKRHQKDTRKTLERHQKDWKIEIFFKAKES